MSAFDPAIFHVKRIFLNKREDNVPFEGAFEKKKNGLQTRSRQWGVVKKTLN
jgi:hypothetical protein